MALVSPPPTINDTCAAPVSAPLSAWLHTLAPGSTVELPTGSCYRLPHGLRLAGADDLTISGGTLYDPTMPKAGQSPSEGPQAIVWAVSGTNVTITGTTIVGANAAGGYHVAGAFEAGIRSDGVHNLDIQHVTISHTFGDGIELAPLRGPGDDAGSEIRAPTRGVVIQDVTITGAGRQGISLVSVRGAFIETVTLRHTALDVFDAEADQWNEGARDVLIDGCEVDGGGVFFANAGASSGSFTGNIAVNGCTMAAPQGAQAIIAGNSATARAARGPLTFNADTLRCGANPVVACVGVRHSDVTLSHTTIVFSRGTLRAIPYRVVDHGSLTLEGGSLIGPHRAPVVGPDSTLKRVPG